MKISIQFNRFIFGVVLEQIRDVDEIIIDEPRFAFRPRTIKKESLRNLLKYLDLNYPRNDVGEPFSYTKLTSKEMSDHLEFIVKSCNGNMKYINDEWNRLISTIRN